MRYLIAALVLMGCHNYRGNPSGTPSAAVFQARVALCRAAQGHHLGENFDLAMTATELTGDSNAVGLAYNDYKNGDWDDDDCRPQLPKGLIQNLWDNNDDGSSKS
jgi:hypothetical protein